MRRSDSKPDNTSGIPSSTFQELADDRPQSVESIVVNILRSCFFLLFVLWLPQAPASGRLHWDDLSELASVAEQKNLPILLIVSQDYCPFCERLKEEIIAPMQISGDYEDRVVIAEIFLDSSTRIANFDNRPVEPGAIAEAYQVWVTPTLLFLDHRGREIHKRMLGVNTIEMYGYYLDESLAAALHAVRKGDTSYAPSREDIYGDAPGYDERF